MKRGLAQKVLTTSSLEKIIEGKGLFWGIVIICCAYQIALAFLSQSSWGGADAIVHYRMAKYSWTYPHLFLNLWGKPVFTTLSSPFAQFGFEAMKLFNILVAALSVYWGYRILDIRKDKGKLILIPLMLFAPIYFILIASTMTEPLFGGVLIFSGFLFFNKKYLWGAITIGFLPFVRNEGFIMLPFFILALMYLRKFKLIPFVFLGLAFIGIIGAIQSGDPAWLITHTPYFSGYEDFRYPSGTFDSYLRRLPWLWSYPTAVLGFLGIIILALKALLQRKKEDILSLLLIAFPVLTYVAAHSFVFWQGIGGAMGLDRIMSAVVPSVALIGIIAISPGIKLGRKYHWVLTLVVFIGISLHMVPTAIKQYRPPLKLTPFQKALVNLANWMEDHELPGDRKVYYYHPYICHALGLDPYDLKVCEERIPFNPASGPVIKDSAVVIWDSHFGPNEGLMPLDTLMASGELTKLAEFEEPLDVGIFTAIVLIKDQDKE